MTVRKTESRLPSWVIIPESAAALAAGLAAGLPAAVRQLGQAVSSNEPRPPATQPAYFLVSFLTSPLVQGSRNDYVIFVTKGTADRYYWKITDDDGRVIEEDDDDVGVFDWTPDEIGDYVVDVTVKVGANSIALRSMRQSVVGIPGKELYPTFLEELTALAAEAPSAGPAPASLKHSAVTGDPDSTTELLLDLWGYIFEASNATNADPSPAKANHGVPAPFLAAILYQSILTEPKTWSVWRFWVLGPGLRTTELHWAADEINKPDSFQFSREIDNALGIAKIRMETAAMVLGALRFADGPAVTDWKDKSEDPKQRKEDEKIIQQAFVQAFGDPTKAATTVEERQKYERRIDLFNLLRFPKTNIAICAKLLSKLKNRERRFPDLTQQGFKDNLIAPALKDKLNAMELIATEYQIGAVATPLTDPLGRLVARSNAFGRKVRKLTNAPFISPHIKTEDNLDTIYGDHDLSQAGPHSVAETTDLQTDLSGLGFRLSVEPPAVLGTFNVQTEWAVREFQMYSKMDFIAREIPHPPAGADTAGRLRTTPNFFRYGGPVSGVVNSATRRRVQVWKTKKWRCPVVIQARSPDGTTPHEDNIWRYDAVQLGPRHPTLALRRRMYVRDFSKYYEFPTGPLTDRMYVLGHWSDYPGTWNGPISEVPAETWGEGEILPERLLPTRALLGERTLADLNDRELSTFKVVRAVSEVECMGFFDCVNAYDNAYVSLGPCHWTLGVVIPGTAATASEGELCAFLAYLRYVDPSTFYSVAVFFGMRPHERWGNPVDENDPGNGQDLYKRTRKFAGWVMRQTEAAAGWERLSRARDEGLYFRTWHWFYRWVMAGRTVDGFRRRMWHMARMRLRDILSTPWVAPPPDDIPDATIGDVFTSERAVALLLRWHVYSPGSVVTQHNQPGNALVQSYRRARTAQLDVDRLTLHSVDAWGAVSGGGLPPPHHLWRDANDAAGWAWGAPPAWGPPTSWGAPDTWTDADVREERLVDALMLFVRGLAHFHPDPNGRFINAGGRFNDSDKDLKETMYQIHQSFSYPDRPRRGYQLRSADLGRLATKRHSFMFDDRDLPMAPDYTRASAPEEPPI